MSPPYEPRAPQRPPLVERDVFDDRNDVLFLLLGLVSMAERILSVVPELVEPPNQDAGAARRAPSQPARILR